MKSRFLLSFVVASLALGQAELNAQEGPVEIKKDGGLCAECELYVCGPCYRAAAAAQQQPEEDDEEEQEPLAVLCASCRGKKCIATPDDFMTCSESMPAELTAQWPFGDDALGL